MSQGDLLIFINTVFWFFFLYFFFYIILFGKLLPSLYKNIRLQTFFFFFGKRQFLFFFLNFLDKLVWFRYFDWTLKTSKLIFLLKIKNIKTKTNLFNAKVNIHIKSLGFF